MNKAILLSTLNARYIHSSFGLRYLLANLGDLQSQAEICEFTIQERPHEIVEALLKYKPTIIGFGVYIWNVRQTEDVVSLLKRVAPQIKIVLGGPEISYETDLQSISRLVDYIVTGEADIVFPQLCKKILNGEAISEKVLKAAIPQCADIALPYRFYSDEDIKNRVIYVEASRGCPFTCEFCLSSLDIPVRQFEIDRFLAAMTELFERGVRHFKFVDRTFNLHLRFSKAILEFFLERYQPGVFIHFEMVPDRLPEQLRELIVKFPAGSLQFEIGIQTFNPEVSARISRRQDYSKIDENLRFLRQETGVHLHVDLIVGLPGETIESFAAGLNHLVALDPHEIQIGILKRLRGTSIVRHDQEWGMVYAESAPYELLQNSTLDYLTMQRMGRFARFWDLIINSGNFPSTKQLIWQGSAGVFEGFMVLSDWLFARTSARHGFSLKRITDLLYAFLTEVKFMEAEVIAPLMIQDYLRTGAQDIPAILKPFLARQHKPSQSIKERQSRIPARQERHSQLV
jgi:radical SAM superfamily enzyme YgiQ (UPF0313 family)